MFKRSVQISSWIFWTMSSPTGMCLVHGEGDTHSLVLSDYTGRCLWWLTTEKQAGDVKIGHTQQHKLNYTPFILSGDRSRRAVVTDGSKSCVYVYSQPGQQVTSLQLAGGLKLCLALTDQSDGYVLEDVYHPGQLVWLNSAGQETRRYTGQPAVRPEHIVEDGTNLLVSDSHNNCVHIVTREGRHNGHLITGIDPICVCLYPAGRRLWVAYKGQGRKSHVMEMSYTPQSSAVTSPVTSALTSSVCSLTLKVNLPKIL